MMKTFSKQVLALLLFVPLKVKSQNTIEPYIGYAIDLANKQPFSQVYIGLQYPVIKDRIYQMLIRIQSGLPLNKHAGNDVAYTADPAMPLSVITDYKTQWYSGAFIIGNRFRLLSWADKNTLSPFINAGVIYQKIAVEHGGYDREKYTVLNPHKSLRKFGLCIGTGVQYKRDIGRGSLFLQAEFLSSPVVDSLNNYSFKLPVPLAVNIGYVVEFKKRSK